MEHMGIALSHLDLIYARTFTSVSVGVVWGILC